MKRWFQFSLRGLLVCLTAFALWLGRSVEQARRQKNAIAAIHRTGGTVVYSWQYNARGVGNARAECPIPEWLRQFVGDDFFFKVASVSFGRSARDGDLACLSKIDHEAIEFLYLGNTWVTDTAVLGLPEMPRLKALSLNGTTITDAALSSLPKYPELKYLRLDDTEITDVGLKNAEHLPHLKSVSLHHTKWLVRGHIELRQRLPNCHMSC